MLTKIQDIQIPVSKRERLVPHWSWSSWNRRNRNTDEYTQYPNCVFYDEVVIDSFAKTSSGSPYMKVRSNITGYLYPMRWVQMKDLLEHGMLERGCIDAHFSFVYRWQYYSLGLFDPNALYKIVNVKEPEWWIDRKVYEIDH